MGNVPAFPGGAVKECCAETMKTFSPVYLKAFAVELIKEMKAEREGKPGPTYLLDSLPTPSEPLKMGWVEKEGAVKKNWKKRWLIAGNAADDFTIFYYVKEQEQPDEKAAKGKINLCGYRVKKVKPDKDDEDEIKKYGEFCLKVYPNWYGERRRTWYLKFEDKETMKSWKGVIKYAAQRAPAPMNKDPVMRAAFEKAYQRTRWELCVWGWWRSCLTEEEMLGQLVVDRCNSDIMQPVYSKVSGRFAYRIRKQLESTLDSTVGAAVGGQWKVASAAVTTAKPKIKAQVEEQIGPLLDKQVELQNKISEAISAKVTPAVEKVVAPVLKPLVQALMMPFFKAEKKAVKIFTQQMKQIFSSSDISYEIREFDRRCCWYWSVLYDAFRKIYALTRYDSTKAKVGKFKLAIPIGDIIEMLGDVSLWRVEDKLEDVVRQLVRDSIYTYKAQVEEGAEHGEKVLNDVLGKMVHDAKIHGREEMAGLLFEVVETRLKKEVMPALAAVLEPIDSLVPESFKTLLDVNDMATNVINNIVMDAIYAAMDSTHQEMFAKLDVLAPNGVAGASGSSAAAAGDKKDSTPAPAAKTETSDPDVSETPTETPAAITKVSGGAYTTEDSKANVDTTQGGAAYTADETKKEETVKPAVEETKQEKTTAEEASVYTTEDSKANVDTTQGGAAYTVDETKKEETVKPAVEETKQEKTPAEEAAAPVEQPAAQA